MSHGSIATQAQHSRKSDLSTHVNSLHLLTRQLEDRIESLRGELAAERSNRKQAVGLVVQAIDAIEKDETWRLVGIKRELAQFRSTY